MKHKTIESKLKYTGLEKEVTAEPTGYLQMQNVKESVAEVPIRGQKTSCYQEKRVLEHSF